MRRVSQSTLPSMLIIICVHTSIRPSHCFNFLSSSSCLIYYFTNPCHIRCLLPSFQQINSVYLPNIPVMMLSPDTSPDSTPSEDRKLQAESPQVQKGTLGTAAQVQSPPRPASSDPGFGVSSGTPVPKRRRRPFDPQRRSEVAAVRRVGACEYCRQRKIKASFI